MRTERSWRTLWLPVRRCVLAGSWLGRNPWVLVPVFAAASILLLVLVVLAITKRPTWIGCVGWLCVWVVAAGGWMCSLVWIDVRRILLRRRRVRLFEHLFRECSRPDLGPPSLLAAEAELEHRDSNWLRQPRHNATRTGPWTASLSWPLVVGLCSAALALEVLRAANVLVLPVKPLLTSAVFLAAVVFNSVFYGRIWFRLDTCRHGNRCPDCSYPFTDLPGAFPAELTKARFGPRRCPECGSPWPLIPPPVHVPED